MIDHAPISGIQPRDELEQHIPALDFQRAGRFAGGGNRADLGAGIGQPQSRRGQQQIEHRAGETVLQVIGRENIFGQNIHQVSDRAFSARMTRLTLTSGAPGSTLSTAACSASA